MNSKRKNDNNISPEIHDIKKEDFDYMKQDFLDAYHAVKIPETQFINRVEATFELAKGTLIDFVTSIKTEELAFSNARSAVANNSAQTAQIFKSVDDYDILITNTVIKDSLSLKVNVINRNDNIEQRPFFIEVLDDNETVISPTIEVDKTSSAPEYPSPEAGIYVFCLQWDDYVEEVIVEFKEE